MLMSRGALLPGFFLCEFCMFFPLSGGLLHFPPSRLMEGSAGGKMHYATLALAGKVNSIVTP